MSAERIVERLRRFLLYATAAVFIVTPVELWLSEHYQTGTQLIPFVLCGIGLVSVVTVLFAPSRASLLTLRVIMGVTLLGSLLGVYEHLTGNLEFVLEIHNNISQSEALLTAMKGADPLLAPGILALAAVLAIGATYYHPALQPAKARELRTEQR